MKHVFVLALLVAAACAPPEHDLSVEASAPALTAAAGSGAVAATAAFPPGQYKPCEVEQWVARIRNTLESVYGCQHNFWYNGPNGTLANDKCLKPGGPAGALMRLRAGYDLENAEPNICKLTVARKLSNGNYCMWLREHCIIEPWSTSCSGATQIFPCNT